jgi:outer membrane lipoprotein carrier protein
MVNMKIFYKQIVLFAVLFSLVLAADVTAYKFDFIMVGDIVDKVKNNFSKIDAYQANFEISIEKLGKKTVQSGIIKYKSSDKLLVEFNKPYGQKIVSDGKTMWVYIPSMNVVAEQDLMSDAGLFSTSSRSGLERLFEKYHYRFASKEEPEVMSNGEKKYTILLKQKETRSGYRKIKLWISKNYFIESASGETSTGKKVEIKFSGINTSVDLPSGIFKFDIPARARVIKNPMITEE